MLPASRSTTGFRMCLLNTRTTSRVAVFSSDMEKVCKADPCMAEGRTSLVTVTYGHHCGTNGRRASATPSPHRVVHAGLERHSWVRRDGRHLRPLSRPDQYRAALNNEVHGGTSGTPSTLVAS